MAFNKTQLKNLVDNNLPDNSAGLITPENNRALVKEIIDTAFATVASISALKNYDTTDLKDGDKLEVLGYYNSGDGGGGVFYWDITSTSTDDGGITIIPTHIGFGGTGRWKRRWDRELDLKDFGATGNGTTDDYVAINNAISSGNPLVVSFGEYKIGTNITLNTPMRFLEGGVINPDSGVTVTLNEDITAGSYKIFDIDDGTFTITRTHKLPFVRAEWFGGIVLETNQSTTTVTPTQARSNAKSIRTALSSVSLGVGAEGGIYRTPKVIMPTGLIVIDDDDADGIFIEVPSYSTLIGEGDSTVLRPIDNALAGDIIQINDSGANSIILDNFKIYGEASSQTNEQNGIVFNCDSAAIYCYIGRNIYIKEMNGYGIWLAGQGADNTIIEPKIVRDSTKHGLLVQGCASLTIQGGMYRTSKAGFSGIVFDGVGCITGIVQNCIIDENNSRGIFITNTNGRFMLRNNKVASNGDIGIFVDRSDYTQILNNYVEQNTKSGIVLDDSIGVQINNNILRSNGEHGIGIFSSDDTQVNSNSVAGNSITTDNTYSGIFIGSVSTYNIIANNIVRRLTGVNQQKYGIEIQAGTDLLNMVVNNDLYASGKSGAFLDNGGSTVTTSGNRS